MAPLKQAVAQLEAPYKRRQFEANLKRLPEEVQAPSGYRWRSDAGSEIIGRSVPSAASMWIPTQTRRRSGGLCPGCDQRHLLSFHARPKDQRRNNGRRATPRSNAEAE